MAGIRKVPGKREACLRASLGDRAVSGVGERSGVLIKIMSGGAGRMSEAPLFTPPPSRSVGGPGARGRPPHTYRAAAAPRGRGGCSFLALGFEALHGRCEYGGGLRFWSPASSLLPALLPVCCVRSLKTHPLHFYIS